MNALNQIAQKTSNDILLLAIVLATVVLTMTIPFYKALSKSAKERRQQELAHERLLLEVVRDNTKVNAGLKALLETSNRGCESCKRDQSDKFNRLESKIDVLIKEAITNG